jgi:hypothetical protein
MDKVHTAWAMRAVARLVRKVQRTSAVKPVSGLLGSLQATWAVAPLEAMALQAGLVEGGIALFLT